MERRRLEHPRHTPASAPARSAAADTGQQAAAWPESADAGQKKPGPLLGSLGDVSGGRECPLEEGDRVLQVLASQAPG